MKDWKYGIAVLLVIGWGFTLTGCSDDGSEGVAGTSQVGVDDYAAIDFSQEFGGLTPTDEEEAFGEPYLLSLVAVEAEEVSDDPLQSDPEVLELEQMSMEPAQPDQLQPRFTFVRITWGMLDGPGDAAGNFVEAVDLLDWTGLLRIDRGIAVVRRLIRFERPYDHLVYPRLDRQTVAWFSHTGQHFDGLLVQIIESPDDLQDEVDREPNRLHFETGPFSRSFVVADLPDLDEVYPVDPAPSGIHFNGFRLNDITMCPKGFLSGIWLTTGEAQGEFRGRWIGLLGRTHGFLRGAWGVNDQGEQVFFGKYIGPHGHFRGLMRGTWEAILEQPGHGIFRGHWVNDAGDREGALGGRYFSLPARPGGFFAGRWANACDPEATAALQ